MTWRQRLAVLLRLLVVVLLLLLMMMMLLLLLLLLPWAAPALELRLSWASFPSSARDPSVRNPSMRCCAPPVLATTCVPLVEAAPWKAATGPVPPSREAAVSAACEKVSERTNFCGM